MEELREAVVWLPSQGVHATVAGIIEQALHAELERLRQQYREGEAFPHAGAHPASAGPLAAEQGGGVAMPKKLVSRTIELDAHAAQGQARGCQLIDAEDRPSESVLLRGEGQSL